MSQYVIVVACCSETTLHGSFRDLARAEEACERLNRAFDGHDEGVAVVRQVLPATQRAVRNLHHLD